MVVVEAARLRRSSTRPPTGRASTAIASPAELEDERDTSTGTASTRCGAACPPAPAGAARASSGSNDTRAFGDGSEDAAAEGPACSPGTCSARVGRHVDRGGATSAAGGLVPHRGSAKLWAALLKLWTASLVAAEMAVVDAATTLAAPVTALVEAARVAAAMVPAALTAAAAAVLTAEEASETGLPPRAEAFLRLLLLDSRESKPLRRRVSSTRRRRLATSETCNACNARNVCNVCNACDSRPRRAVRCVT